MERSQEVAFSYGFRILQRSTSTLWVVRLKESLSNEQATQSITWARTMSAKSGKSPLPGAGFEQDGGGRQLYRGTGKVALQKLLPCLHEVFVKLLVVTAQSDAGCTSPEVKRRTHRIGPPGEWVASLKLLENDPHDGIRESRHAIPVTRDSAATSTS
jgi:hypothetical protein